MGGLQKEMVVGDPKKFTKNKGVRNDSDARVLAVQPWGFEF